MVVMCLVEFGQKDLLASQILPLLASKFDWQTKHDKEFHFTFLTGCTLLGVILGTASGGVLMGYGRRWAILVGVLLAILGACLMQILIFPLFATGSTLV